MFVAGLICYKQPLRSEPTRRGFLKWRPRMTTQNKNHEPEKEKESDKEIRDLPPRKDVKGGNLKDKGSDSGRTAEVDFMQDCD